MDGSLSNEEEDAEQERTRYCGEPHREQFPLVGSLVEDSEYREYVGEVAEIHEKKLVVGLPVPIQS